MKRALQIHMAIKDKEKPYNVKWYIIRKACSYSPTTKSCNLCLTEKLSLVVFEHKEKLLNKRSEFISKCRLDRIPAPLKTFSSNKSEKGERQVKPSIVKILFFKTFFMHTFYQCL